MVAVSPSEPVRVRALRPGEGQAVAGLWRELWDAHEGWGGYTGSKDRHVYEQLAHRLDDDARVRGGQPVLGRHIHLIATVGRTIAGQVEGWFEKHGVDESTPHTCEVRSLIVTRAVRASGVGRALLEQLAASTRELARGAPSFLVAEVLEPNPAHSFYAKVGYHPIAYAARASTARRSSPTVPPVDAPTPTRDVAPELEARIAEPHDALAVAMLDASLAARRRSQGDLRFDRPRSIDATVVGAIAAHLAHARTSAISATELVVTDERKDVRASATLALSSLDPPFLPARRALLGRLAVDPAADPRPYVEALLSLTRSLAAARGAATVEITDLTAPGTPLHDAVLATGATPWSRVVARAVPA
jgi:GNAT superfamily N-acetyltransferase